jgi:hypothetical protein
MCRRAGERWLRPSGLRRGKAAGLRPRRLVNQCVRGHARARVTPHACLPTP